MICWGINMNNVKFITVMVEYESDEIWEESLKDIEELISMMNNISRQATIIEIKEE